MKTYFWGAPPGAPGEFDDANDWFNAESQTFGNGIPGTSDIVNVVGAVPIPPAPPVDIVIPSGEERAISQLRVLFQSVDEDFVWIEGSLRVLDEIFFEKDRGNLRFKGTVTLDGVADDPDTENVNEGGALDGATMDVDYLHIGGALVTSARNVVSVDNDGMLRVVNAAQVTSRNLEVLGTGGLAVLGGGTVDVAGPVVIEQSAGAPPVSVDGQGSRLVVHGTSGYGLDISGLGSLSITTGGTVDVTGKTVLHSGSGPVLVDGAFSSLVVKGSYGLDISGLGSLKITNGGTADVSGKVAIKQDTFAPAVSVDGPGSALLVGDGLALDGYLFVTRGASGRADGVTINSTSIASLVVGDLTGQGITSLVTANTVTLGDGQGGSGFLTALPNGQVRVKQSLTLLNPITDASTFSGALGTTGDGWIEIGPHTLDTPDVQPNTIQVNPGGISLGLVGHGMVDTGTFRNDGLVGALDGLLLIDADVTGKGIFGVATNSTLEIDGNVDSTVTIALGGSFSTLTLDVHDKFDGKIASIDLTDTIRLRHDFGETVKWAAILVTADTEVEPDEGFLVSLAAPSAGLAIGVGSVSGSIVNDDATVSIAALSAARAEGNAGPTAFTFILALRGDTSVAHSFTYAVSGLGPVQATGSDFAGGTLPTGTVTFASGESARTITVDVLGDTTVEADEGFTVTLSNRSAGLAIGQAAAAGTIQNDDGAVVSIVALSAAMAEEDSGTTSFTFTISLDQASTTSQTADWAVTGSGEAAADAVDFGGTFPSGTVSFAAGETTKTVTVSVTGDTAAELNEDFAVTLSNLSFGLLPGTAAATGTIQNDDRPAVSITGGAATQLEGNSGATAYDFTVSLDRAGITSQSVSWAVTGTGANPANAADFGGTLPSGSLTFVAGETSKVITLNVSGDSVVEFDEAFGLTLSSPSSGVDLGPATRIGSIVNDDRSTVSIAALSAVKAEGSIGTTASTFTISLSQGGVTAQTVSWAVAGSGTNPAGATDFAGGVLPGGVVAFAPGETSKVVTVNVAGDTTLEPDEGYGVTLSNLSAGLVAGVASATGTIQNDDVAVAVAAHNDAYVVLRGESLTATASVLSNDVAATTATLLSGPAHGSLQLAGNGTFTYAPAAGFVGIDSFAYRAGNGVSTDDGQVYVYNNLFNRSSDAGGLAYWTDQVKQTLQAGQFVGSILVNIMGGAQDTAAGKDITTLIGKVAVSLAFVREQEEHDTAWAGASDIAAATTLLQAVTADPQSVLVGVRNAETVIEAHA